MRESIEHALQTGAVIHLIGGTDTDADEIVDEVRDATDSELRRVACTPDTTADALPTARVPEGTLIYYKNFGELPSEVQVTAAQCIKGHFEHGLPVIVQSSEEARADLTLRNGDLRGRVQAVELDGKTFEESPSGMCPNRRGNNSDE